MWENGIFLTRVMHLETIFSVVNDTRVIKIGDMIFRYVTFFYHVNKKCAPWAMAYSPEPEHRHIFLLTQYVFFRIRMGGMGTSF